MSYPNFSILLVDDEEAFLRSMSITLERQGNINNIMTCNDSRLVMDILKEENIGLILLDLTMPHISGEELLESISEQYPQISIIIFSGMNQLETVVQCIRKGAYDYFVKTSDKQQLIDSVRRAISIQENRIEHQAIRKQLAPKQKKPSQRHTCLLYTSPSPRDRG